MRDDTHDVLDQGPSTSTPTPFTYQHRVAATDAGAGAGPGTSAAGAAEGGDDGGLSCSLAQLAISTTATNAPGTRTRKLWADQPPCSPLDSGTPFGTVIWANGGGGAVDLTSTGTPAATPSGPIWQVKGGGGAAPFDLSSTGTPAATPAWPTGQAEGGGGAAPFKFDSSPDASPPSAVVKRKEKKPTKKKAANAAGSTKPNNKDQVKAPWNPSTATKRS